MSNFRKFLFVVLNGLIVFIIVGMVILGVFNYREDDLAFFITLFVALGLLLLLYGLDILVFIRWIRSQYESAISRRYFSLETTGIYSEYLLQESLAKKIRRRKIASGILLSFSIKDFKEDVLDIFGQDFAKDVLSAIEQTLRSRYYGTHNVYYAFDYVNTFSLFMVNADRRKACREYENLIGDLSAKIDAIGMMFDYDIVAGAAEYSINDIKPIRHIFTDANKAKTWNDGDEYGKVVFYNDKKEDGSSDEFDILHDIDTGLKNGDFQVYYQPKYDLKLKRFVGAEALVRWSHPVRGIIQPIVFIKSAEQTGKIVDIDRFVFRRVCQDIASWRDKRMRLLSISSNLSNRTLRDASLFDFIQQTIAEYQVNPLLIEFEITETIASRNQMFVYSLVKKLKEMNISMAMDDMGTGYSSLSSIKRLPFSSIKIDKSFFDDIEVDKKSRDIVSTIANLGEALDMKVVAEGIHNAKQVEIISKMNIDIVQGYYYSQPLSRNAFELFLQKNNFESRRGSKQ